MYQPESEQMFEETWQGKNPYSYDRKHEILALMKQTCASHPLPGHENTAFPGKI